MYSRIPRIDATLERSKLFPGHFCGKVRPEPNTDGSSRRGKLSALRSCASWKPHRITLPSVVRWCNQRRLSPAKFLVEHAGHREHLIFFIGPADNLHTDGKAAGRLGYRNRDCGVAEQVVMLAVRHGARIIDFVDRSPARILMRECRDGADRRQQDRNLLHFGKKLSA